MQKPSRAGECDSCGGASRQLATRMTSAGEGSFCPACRQTPVCCDECADEEQAQRVTVAGEPFDLCAACREPATT